jgi:hypothetical protein
VPTKPSTTMLGTVEKIIKPLYASEPEKAQIAVKGADDLYREIRVENVLVTENGDEVQLKEGANVEVSIEAEEKSTVPKNTKIKPKN